MKTITFESFRRFFVSGGRKRDRDESSFKRSESFKRISIRKNYLERGGKGRNPLYSKILSTKKLCNPKIVVREKESAEDSVTATKVTSSSTEPESLVIDYGEWIRCIQAEDKVSFQRKTTSTTKSTSSQEILKLDKSPNLNRKFPGNNNSDDQNYNSSSKTDSAISISLGRIWMDAPLAMISSPRSLELPKPSSSIVEINPTGRRIHHSLESALKDKQKENQPFRNRPLSPLSFGRMSSSSTQADSSKATSTRCSTEMLSSSKDSGFSFSILLPRLSPVLPAQAQCKSFFRKKKFTGSGIKRDKSFNKKNGNSFGSRINRKRTNSYSGKKRGNNSRKKSTLSSLCNDMYQVIVNRPSRSSKSQKLDPIIFVPPEKRKIASKQNYEVLEVRDYCVPCDARNESFFVNNDHKLPNDDDDTDQLYEVIAERRSELSGVNSDISSNQSEEEDELLSSSELSLKSSSNSISDQLVKVTRRKVKRNGSSAIIVLPKVRRRPVLRKKSTTRRAAKFTARKQVVVHRAPSTLKRNKKLLGPKPVASPGDITQKGYDKKRYRLLAPYSAKQTPVLEICPSFPIHDAERNNYYDSQRNCGETPRSISANFHDPVQNFLQQNHRDNSLYSEVYQPHSSFEPPRFRRTQRRTITQNERRYHSAAVVSGSSVRAASNDSRSSSAAGLTSSSGGSSSTPNYVNAPSPFLGQLSSSVAADSNSGSVSPVSKSRRRGNRRLTRNESRYHSEVRHEAVQQALAEMQKESKSCLPMPSKRTSVMGRSPDRSNNNNNNNNRHVSESSSDESDEYNTADRERLRRNMPLHTPSISDGSSTGSTTRDTPPLFWPQIQNTRLPRIPSGGSGGAGRSNWDSDISVADGRDERQRIQPPRITQNVQIKAGVASVVDLNDAAIQRLPCPPPPLDMSHTYSVHPRRGAPAADRLNRVNNQPLSRPSSEDGTNSSRYKVSAKIQQLLNTLKRPKRRPLPEFYEDDDIELEIAANSRNPHAPHAEGATMTPVLGEPLIVPAGLPRSLEAAIQRYGCSHSKSLVATVLDPNGKLTTSITYGKLSSRSMKVAYTLLNKSISGKGATEVFLKSGDRVALVYPNNDPINFLCGFYGCIIAGLVPVPIEVPLTRRDAGSQQIGFLLGSCNVQAALTSEACMKGMPKGSTGEIAIFKGWPKMYWIITEHLPKPPKDWCPAPKLSDDVPAYIEYVTDRDGSVMGVTVSRAALMSHCRALTQACEYESGEAVVCVLDFKKETGLWHGVLTSVLNALHVIFIPYALMKVNPAAWMLMITKHKAASAIVKSRDLHWGLLATKDHKDISLSSLRLLLIGDGANPWCLSSCEHFISVFQSKGLKPNAVCTCASSSECGTVSLRRPGRTGVNATGRGVLSMSGLSYGVVRVDQENSLTSLTLQDCGHVMPGTKLAVIRMDSAYLCKSDEVGEISVSSDGTASQYWGLPGLSNSTFKVNPLLDNGKPLGDSEFARSGLLGFMGPNGLVFVCGSRDGLMVVSGRRHNADDIIATVLAVEPTKFIFRGRICVFSIRVLRDERICVVAEQRPECNEEESFQWMSRVLQAVDSIHQLGLYCLALVPPNYLPKSPLGGISLSECKKRFSEGNLHPANVLLCPHTCVTNLPKPRIPQTDGKSVADVGPASVMVGNIVQGNRLAIAQGRDMGPPDEDADTAKKFITEILKWRAHSTADHVIFTLLNSKGASAATITCSQLHKKAERIGSLLLERAKINTGDHVALIFPPGIDLICAFYGCLFVGAIPVTIRPPHPQNLQTTLPTVRMIVEVSKSVLVLSNQNVIKLLKTKEACIVIDMKLWPSILDTDDVPKKKLAVMYRAPSADMLAYLDFSVSTTGMLGGIQMSHSALTSLCRSMKLACELYPSRHIALCLDPYCGLGFALWCLSSVYSGHHSILIPPSEVEANPSLWISAVSQHRVRDTFCSYGVMELCTKGLAASVPQLKQRGVNLNCVRTCVVVAEERPRINLTASFSKLFSDLGLSSRAVSTSFGCRVNVAICLQGASSPEPSNVYVDLRALRSDRVSLVERGSPHSLCLLESGKLLPGVKVIIADPETKGQCGDSHLGEIWVQSPHNCDGYFSIYGENNPLAEQFNAHLVTGNTNEAYARTGYLGFLRRTETGQHGSKVQPAVDISSTTESDLHDAVFVVGALDEAIQLRGMRFHPIDIETSVMRTHKKIAECAAFAWTDLLVIVVELDGHENEALDLVPLITNAVLEEHHLIVGIAVVVDLGVVPINSRGEKQRMHLRDGFLADQLDPIYVAYNM